MKLNKKIPASYFITIAIVVYLLLLVLVISSRSSTCFDEKLFINNMGLFNEYGLSRPFLLQMTDQAPGPLYQMVHYPIQSITKLAAPPVRVVNMLLFSLVICFTALNIRLLFAKEMKKALAWASTLIFVPVVWQVAGLALTEIPAMTANCIAIWLLLLSMKRQTMQGKPQSLLLALAGGIFLGLSIWGRSPFLLVGIAAIVLPLYRRDYFLLVAAFLVPAFIMALPIFFIWKGLVPPHQQYISHGISIWHGFLAFAYMGIVALLVAPRWFKKFKWQWPIFLGTYIFLWLLNYVQFNVTYFTLGFAIKQILPPSIFKFYPFLIAPALMLISIYFLLSTLFHLYENRKNPLVVFLLLGGMLLLASCAGITHLFSTRYVAQVSPVFVILFVGYDNFSQARILRFAIGAAIGAASLYTYLIKF